MTLYAQVRKTGRISPATINARCLVKRASPHACLLGRLFTPEIATFYEEFLTSKGITFMKGDTASAFEGKDGKARLSCRLTGLWMSQHGH